MKGVRRTKMLAGAAPDEPPTSQGRPEKSSNSAIMNGIRRTRRSSVVIADSAAETTETVCDKVRLILLTALRRVCGENPVVRCGGMPRALTAWLRPSGIRGALR
jgi:hypothetical protein